MVLALTVAKASALRSVPPETGPALQFEWFAQIAFLVVMAGYVAAILAVTARRSRVAPATLAVGTSAGIALGVVMYAVAPLGLTDNATEPWLRGSAIDPVVALAWILLLGGPVVAGNVAARRYRGPGSPAQQLVKVWQGAVAGFLATGIGALIVTVLGTGTVALMPRAAWLRHLLYPGQHLLAATAYSRGLTASELAQGYRIILVVFPLIGLVLGMFIIGDLATSRGPSPGGGGPPGPPGPEPVPDPPDGGRVADGKAGTGVLAAGLPGWSEEGPDSEHDQVTAGVAG